MTAIKFIGMVVATLLMCVGAATVGWQGAEAVKTYYERCGK